MEIERQFLSRPFPPSLLAMADESVRIRQGYLTTGDPAVRVRETRPLDGDAPAPDASAVWTLTAKSGHGLVRREAEFELDARDGERLMAAAGAHVVEKDRHRVGRWELDVFRGRHAGIHVAEVELESPAETLPERPAGLETIREVTDSHELTNQRLAWMGDREAAEVAERLRREVDAPP